MGKVFGEKFLTILRSSKPTWNPAPGSPENRRQWTRTILHIVWSNSGKCDANCEDTFLGKTEEAKKAPTFVQFLDHSRPSSHRNMKWFWKKQTQSPLLLLAYFGKLLATFLDSRPYFFLSESTNRALFQENWKTSSKIIITAWVGYFLTKFQCLQAYNCGKKIQAGLLLDVKILCMDRLHFQKIEKKSKTHFRPIDKFWSNFLTWRYTILVKKNTHRALFKCIRSVQRLISFERSFWENWKVKKIFLLRTKFGCFRTWGPFFKKNTKGPLQTHYDYKVSLETHR